jgi:hypothetical protein
VLDWIVSTFGGRVSKNGEQATPRNHITWRWRTSAQEASRVLSLVLPFLHIKQTQASLAIEFQSRVSSLKANFASPLSPTEISWRDDQRLAISALNLRARSRV